MKKERLRGQFCNIAAVFYEKKVSVFLPGRNAMFFRSEACRCFFMFVCQLPAKIAAFL